MTREEMIHESRKGGLPHHPIPKRAQPVAVEKASDADAGQQRKLNIKSPHLHNNQYQLNNQIKLASHSQFNYNKSQQ